jgi:hypothetical protein
METQVPAEITILTAHILFFPYDARWIRPRVEEPCGIHAWVAANCGAVAAPLAAAKLYFRSYPR